MNRIIFVGLILFLAILILDLGSRAQALNTRAVVEKTLPNGLKVLLLENRKAPVVTIQIWYNLGARDEPLGKSGLTHLGEHLMFRGTQKVGPKMFSRIIQKNGGQENAFTSRDYTAYYENMAADRVAIALELELDRMTNLQVDEQKFMTELKVVQEERRLRIKDDPVASLYEEVNAVAFKSHPYQRPVIGWMEDLEGLAHRDFLDFYKTYYHPGNATLVVAGDFQSEKMLPLIQEYFGPIPSGPSPPRILVREPPQEAGKRVVLHRAEARLPYVVLAFHVPVFPHPDAFALEVMSHILAGGKSSRLYQKMVYEEQKALEVEADFPFNSRDPHLFLCGRSGHARQIGRRDRATTPTGIGRMGPDPSGPGGNRPRKKSGRGGIYFQPGFRLLPGHAPGQIPNPWILEGPRPISARHPSRYP